MQPRSTLLPPTSDGSDATGIGVAASSVGNEVEVGEGSRPAGPDRTNAKVRQVLDAARALFLEQPYDAVSTDAIARRAGISKATLYVHFESKEMLFATLVCDQCRAIEEAVWSAGGPGGDVEAVLRTIARNFMAMLAGPEAISLYRTIVAQVPRRPELGRVFYEAGPKILQARIAQFLERACERGELQVPDPRLAAVQFLQLVAGDIPMTGLLALRPLTPEHVATTIESGIRVFMAAHRPSLG
ncbi:TetR/AcrR family transcriptional regulator [Aureimonas pseudogalii]|uniref:AcrR family transcriptional regulator n=1 Tax=Aureimonas pseudogalii TaxID=1744844 RepID=A0A7W6H6K1_9HYPH|nr:TetR/AcrR family transcriptional regulator [Aureimonas pseudogalii]MBB3999471.1 AcrR family transcriptional regulator [Aureimonas pseudogalii]